MKKPARYYKLSQALSCIKDETWFSWSKNRLLKRAGNALRRASRRVLKQQGRQEISDILQK